jgi:hypothetical protein
VLSPISPEDGKERASDMPYFIKNQGGKQSTNEDVVCFTKYECSFI